MARKVRKKLGEIIVEQGLTTEEVVAAASSTAQDTGKKLGEVLVEEGHATEVAVAQAAGGKFAWTLANSSMNASRVAAMPVDCASILSGRKAQCSRAQPTMW